MAGRSRTKLDCLEVLRETTSAVLRHLLSSYPKLVPDAQATANALLATVSFTDIARSVFEALIALDLNGLDAGPSAAGYVEPSEAAWAVIENVTAPYFRDLERRVKLRHDDEATALCHGIVLGRYRAEQRGFELLEYAEDGPSNLPAKRLRSGNVGAATFRSRVRSLSSSHLSGIGSFDEVPHLSEEALVTQAVWRSPFDKRENSW